jgi:hypothetical protein
MAGLTSNLQLASITSTYEPMMESDDIVLMNDKVEQKLYYDEGVPVESKNWYLSAMVQATI